jgi:uncharacterized protein YqgC (DUF456 family)
MSIDTLAIGIGLAYTLFALLCVLLVVAGLPGTWLMILAAIIVDCVDRMWLPPGSPLTFHPVTIVVAIVVGLVGELLEFAMSAVGATKRGMLGAMIGGVAGALAGTALIWIPILGTIVGALVGTAAGAVIGETWRGQKSMKEATQPAIGAVIGRVLGTLAKLPVAVIVLAILVVAVFRP